MPRATACKNQAAKMSTIPVSEICNPTEPDIVELILAHIWCFSMQPILNMYLPEKAMFHMIEHRRVCLKKIGASRLKCWSSFWLPFQPSHKTGLLKKKKTASPGHGHLDPTKTTTRGVRRRACAWVQRHRRRHGASGLESPVQLLAAATT